MPTKAGNNSEKSKTEVAEKKLKHKLNSIKNDFESGNIKSFEQIFAILGPSVWAKLMHMGYETFLNKSKNPGAFTNNELIFFSEIIDTDINLVLKFIYVSMNYKNKFKNGEAIRL